jgi:hypothetical protein
MQMPVQPRQQAALAEMRDVLGDAMLELRVVRYRLDEDMAGGVARIEAQLTGENGRTSEVGGEGVGMIDALFHALRSRYAPEYPSLESIRFTEFSIKGMTGDGDDSASTAGRATAEVEITNSYGVPFRFAAVTESVTRSSIEATVAAVQYFVNAERAYVTMYKALEHYRAEGRVDLVERYTARLADMVRNTSYSSSVERLKADAKH